ncbi:methionyl-tRNA formyltransferase [Solitalea koreensis]|uniref:UDP-4-amino-4-deoxy-L-arabinose formyltransferase / UDP-glucuronic acid dehydrogenase (UDP-4-keto-hexauronic acid decarboxylating) n=1 Tax=Solitalea koreensis TaxID=543615 RepID=A0A521AMH0_9SPHI|nr:formyltransferase family protein [Solitalea koreensis]SMO35951.1 UDP-4-amino-4-deoxy-L-arabinose formyltransferase / UDP-glucuronic acid dehydrogenase (UDP-4-keto-hexauronic acid decarboxylating) [Solitalea koreensis]
MANYKKIAVFGCKQTTKFILDALGDKVPVSLLITIDPYLARENEVADYYDFSEIGNLVKVYSAQSYSLKSQGDINFINAQQIDIAFVIGWQRLLPESILDNLTIGAFGMHGSSLNLPLGRGRSPMNWSIIEDRKVFYTNLFKFNSGIDSGDIVDSFKFTITERDNAATMHFKNTLAMKYLIEKNLAKLLKNEQLLHKQPAIIPTYYPKRNPDDSLIEWDRDLYYIERFIRAVTKPFNGAFSFLNGEKMVIFQSQPFDVHEFGYDNEEPGTIVEVLTNEAFLVKCFGGLLLVTDFVFKGLLKRGMRFGNNGTIVTDFQLNKFGFYDIPEENFYLINKKVSH